MRKIKLLCVGNIKEKFFVDAINEYAKRLSRFCSLTILELPEYNGSLDKEAEAILKNIAGAVILFDRVGNLVSSEDFSTLISKSFVSGTDTITFIIGGSDGVSSKVRNIATHLVSFGKVTYPHRLMRVIALEQIYRAFTIQGNMPYHK